MFKILKVKSMRRLLVLAIIIRLLIMPFYFHPDIKTYHYQASFLKKGVFNIYTYLISNRESLPLKEEFVYFPLTYFFLGGYQFISTQFLGSNFDSWLSDASAQAVDKIGTFRYLFILKLPYLIIDLIIPFLLTLFFEDIRQKRKVFIFGLFNPISVALIYFYSNIDIIPVALSLISLLLFRNKKYALSGLTLGLAAGFKAYPLLFLPFLLLHTNSVKESFKMLFISIGVLILIISPFWSNAFLSSALVSGLTTRIVFPNIPIGFGENLMVAISALTILFFAGLTNTKNRDYRIWLYLMFVLMSLFSTIHYHIQWLLWIMPFLTIFSVFRKNLSTTAFIWLILAFIIPLLYDDKSMSIALLSAISPLYNLLPTPFLILQHFYDPFLIQGVIHSIIFGISLTIILRNQKIFKI